MSLNEDYLYSLIKDLHSSEVPLYVDEMTSTKEPVTYVVLERINNDRPSSYGDGTVLRRDVIFTIRIFSNKSSKITNLYKQYAAKLVQENINFDYYGPVMDYDRSYSAQIVGKYDYGI